MNLRINKRLLQESGEGGEPGGKPAESSAETPTSETPPAEKAGESQKDDGFPEESSVDWGKMEEALDGEQDDEDEVTAEAGDSKGEEAEPEPAPKEEAPKGEKDEESKKPEAAKPEEKVEEKAKEPEKPAAEEKKVDAEPEAGKDEPTPSYEERTQAYLEARKSAEEALAKEYQLSDEDLQLFNEEPEKFIPQRLAKLHLDVMQSVQMALLQEMPNLVERTLKARETEQDYARSFYENWPKLRGHEAHVQRHGTIYRQANPNATPEEYIRDVGASVMIALGIAPDSPEETPAGSKPAPERPAEPASRTPTPRAPGQRTPKNIFEAFDEELDLADQE